MGKKGYIGVYLKGFAEMLLCRFWEAVAVAQ